MARKHDKMRPYRVDYFEIMDMNDGSDNVYVQSVLVRAVTAADAKKDVIASHNETVELLGVPGRIPIRAYRYYQQIPASRGKRTSLKKLFSAEKLKDVSAQITQSIDNAEKSFVHSDAVKTFDRSSSIFGYEMTANSKPTSGPDSPATQAVLADLQGMTDHDKHEQLMDSFVPNPGQPDLSKFDLDAAAPVIQNNFNTTTTPPPVVRIFPPAPEPSEVECDCTSVICEASKATEESWRKWLVVAGIVLLILALGLQYIVAVHK